MNIGPYSLFAIEAGRFGLDGGAMFGIIPRPLWERRIVPDSAGRIPLTTRCLLLISDDRRVLIDTGIGDKFDEKRSKIYAYDTSGGDLVEGLSRVGCAPEDITDVILTHLHFDHCGGSTRQAGDRVVPVFPEAVHHIQDRHWTWAQVGNPREKASFMPENFAPLESEGLLRRLAGDSEILPGVHVESVDGHTEGQQIVRISDGSQTLVFAADLIPTAAHLAPVWGMSYDIRPLVAIEEKERFVRRAAEGGWRVLFEHDANVESGLITMGERGPELTDPARLTDLG